MEPRHADFSPDLAEPYEVVGSARPEVPAEVYRRLFEASFGLTVVADGSGTIRALSDAAAALYETKGSQVGARLADAPWWDDRERVEESLRRARAGMFDRFTTRVTRDGSRRAFLVDVQSIEGPDREVWLLLEARDVTTLLTSEHRLHDARDQLDRERSQLRAVLDATPAAIAGIDAEGRLTAANRAATEMMRLGRGGVPAVGEAFLDESEWTGLWRRALGGETVKELIHRPARDEHAPQWFEATFAPVRSGGRVQGAVVSATDVTVRVEAEQLRQAVERGAAGSFSADADGRLVTAAPEVRALFELPDDASLADVVARTQDPAVAEAAFQSAFDAPGTALDLHVVAGGRHAWVRGRSFSADGAVRLVAVAYDTTGHATAPVARRWADLVVGAGWGGTRGASDRVDVGVEPPDPAAVAGRLAALRRANLLDTGPAEGFDALTRLVSRALGVPVSLVSLVDEDRQFFKSQVGLTGATAEARETPLTHSFCQHVANERRPLVVRDTRDADRLAHNLAVADLDVIAYLGVPIAAPDGHVIGALCAIDHQPHAWTDEDLRLLSSVAEAVSAEVAAHQARSTGGGS